MVALCQVCLQCLRSVQGSVQANSGNYRTRCQAAGEVKNEAKVKIKPFFRPGGDLDGR